MNFSVKISALLFLCASSTAFSMAPGKTLLTRAATRFMSTKNTLAAGSVALCNTTQQREQNKKMLANYAHAQYKKRNDNIETMFASTIALGSAYGLYIAIYKTLCYDLPHFENLVLGTFSAAGICASAPWLLFNINHRKFKHTLNAIDMLDDAELSAAVKAPHEFLKKQNYFNSEKWHRHRNNLHNSSNNLREYISKVIRPQQASLREKTPDDKTAQQNTTDFSLPKQ